MLNQVRRLFQLAALLTCFSIPTVPTHANEKAPRDEPLSLEVEIERGDGTSRLKVYLHNNTDREITLPTESHWGPGHMIDTHHGYLKTAAGLGPDNVPVINFAFGEGGRIALRPPIISRAVQRRRVWVNPDLKLPAEARYLYASFSVPNEHVAGKFLGAEVKFEGNDNSPRPNIVGHWTERLWTNKLTETKKIVNE